MSRVIAAGGGVAEDVDQLGRATSLREGAFSSRLMVGWEHGRSRVPGQLEQRILPKRVAVIGVLIAAGDREHAEAQQGRQRVDHPLRVSPVLDTAGQRLGQAEPALRRAQQDQPAIRRERSAREIGGHFLALHGWKIEREKGILGHGGRGAFVASAEACLLTNFYPNPTTYAMFAAKSSPSHE